MRKVLLIALIAALLVTSSGTAFAEDNGVVTYSNGTLHVAFNTNVKSITVTYNGTSTTYTSQNYVQVPIGVTVTWTATCADGYVIEGGSNTGTFTMTSYYQLNLKAEKLVTYPLTITVQSNVASLSVTIDGATTKYTSSTVVNVRSGASVSWTATAATGYNLSSSSGSFTMTTATYVSPTASVKSYTVIATVTPANVTCTLGWTLAWASGKSLTGAVSDYVIMTVASDGKSVTLTFKKNFSAGEMVLTCYVVGNTSVKATCTVTCGS